MITNIISTIFLVTLVILFLGIWAWAWSPKNKKIFEEMSKLPLKDSESSKGEPNPNPANKKQ